MAPTLDIKQTTSLVMTAKLQQAIKLLQSSNADLTEYIKQEILNNPFLELRDSLQEISCVNEDTKNEKIDDTFHEENLPYVEQSEEPENTPLYENYDSSNNFSMLDILSESESLRQHIEKQISLHFHNEEEKRLALLIADELDDCGWLNLSDYELSQMYKKPIQTIQNILKKLKTFSPTGIFASCLKECLALQLEEKGLLTINMQKLLDHLPILATKNQKKICKLCNINKTQLLELLSQLKSLNPKPAENFVNEMIVPIIPDILVRKINNTWHVSLNQETLPHILLNHYEIDSNSINRQEKKYIKSKLSEAHWLIKNLQQRANTIQKVAQTIFQEQYAFLEFGISRLKPLTLKTIAQKICVHESTVSRVCTEKYAETPHGIFELRFFFSGGISSNLSMDNYSAESVKFRIKQLIDGESPNHILSDNEIKNYLVEEGVVIARRTITKYREFLHIPSSNERRKIKKKLL